MNSFQYKPLETPASIRLLCLRPGNDPQPLFCYLIQVSLDDSPLYNAVSYTWGDAASKQTILCDGYLVQITSNLYDAIQLCRLQDVEHVLWADQLCIDQENIEERNQQVAMMGRIFRSSRNCLAYLGKATEADAQAVQLIHDIDERGEEIPKRIASLGEDPVKFGLPEKTNPVWKYLFKVFSRPWFSRVWIIQEAVLAPSCVLFVGNHYFTLQKLRFVLFVLSCDFKQIPYYHLDIIERDALAKAYRRIGNTTDLLLMKEKGEVEKLAALLSGSRAAAATDPRDKVFGIIGLSTDVEPELLPDYNLEVYEVFVRTARALVRRGDGFNILIEAAINSRVEDLRLPSWVPDWSHGAEVEDLLPGSAEHYNAGGTRAADFRLLANPKVISVHGGLHDTIESLNSIYVQGDEMDGFLNIEKLHSWVTEAQHMLWNADIYHTNESTFTAFWRALIANETVYHFKPTPEYGDKAKAFVGLETLIRSVRQADEGDNSWYNEYKTSLSTHGKVHPLIQTVFPKPLWISAAALEFGTRIMYTCRTRRFCVTKKGYYGVVPRRAQVGDCICVFVGAKLPFVLRSRDDLESYQALGECYIHGISEGELWDRDDFNTEDIIIS